MIDLSPTVTFDFHDTIARCDRWFQMEIRELVPSFLVWHSGRTGQSTPDPELLQTGREAYAALRARISRTGIEQDAVSCLATVLPGLGFTVPNADIRHGVDVLMAATFDDDVVPLPGVIETVDYLSRSGVRLGVISSAVYSPFLHWTLDRFGIACHFALVLTSADVGYYKSHPGIYLRAAERLGVAPEDIVHVGDSFRFDVEGARPAGYRTVWVQGDRPLPDGQPANLTLPDLVGAGPELLRLASWPGSAETITDA